MNISISDVNAELERAYDFFNQELFQGKCKPCMVTIQKKAPRGKTMGWTTPNKIWQNRDPEEARYEINICPHIFHEPIEEVLHTLIHEMVHVFLLQHDEKERQRVQGNYHTKKFRDKATAVGLSVYKIKNYGWARTELPEDGRAVDAIKSLQAKEEVFLFARGYFQKPDGPIEEITPVEPKLRKWTCGCQNVRVGIRDFRAVCRKCKNDFELVTR